MAYGEVHEYDIEKETWSIVGRMQQPRSDHAVSLVKIEDIVDYCVDITTTTTTTTTVMTTTTASGNSDHKDLKSKILFLLSLILLINIF